jgi:threonine dehydrogenase-like Zn-dependent dehydrogenase
MTTREFVGLELEMAYARVLGGRVVGGFDDRGLDVTTCDNSIPAVQVKSSIPLACKFLDESVRRHQFIPVCVGEPGTREAVLDSLRKFGAWIQFGIPGRDRALAEIAKVRMQCAS